MSAPPQSSWVVRKIFGAIKYFVACSSGVTALQQQQFSIRRMYNELRGIAAKVPWKKLTCNNLTPPKCIFICWLAILERLATCDNLLKVGVICDQMCSLCEKEHESISHLFLWRKILSWFGVQRDPKCWKDEIQIVTRHFNSNSKMHEIYKMLLSVTVYFVWRERNYRRLQYQKQDINAIIHQIKLLAYTRCLQQRKLKVLVP